MLIYIFVDCTGESHVVSGVHACCALNELRLCTEGNICMYAHENCEFWTQKEQKIYMCDSPDSRTRVFASP